MTLVMLVMGSQIVMKISHTTWLQQSYTVHPQAVRSKFHMYRKEKKGERASWYITFCDTRMCGGEYGKCTHFIAVCNQGTTLAEFVVLLRLLLSYIQMAVCLRHQEGTFKTGVNPRCSALEFPKIYFRARKSQSRCRFYCISKNIFFFQI